MFNLVFNEEVRLPMTLYFEDLLSAGFPSPAQGEIGHSLNLHEYMVQHPASTFFVRCGGDSMTQAGISPGDLLVIDRSLAPKSESIIVAVINGEFTLKRLIYDQEKIILRPENPKYQDRIIGPEDQFEVWGVLSYCVKKMLP